jgi:hypothetical protein
LSICLFILAWRRLESCSTLLCPVRPPHFLSNGFTYLIQPVTFSYLEVNCCHSQKIVHFLRSVQLASEC